MVRATFATSQEVGEIEETLWLGFNGDAHHILKLRDVAPHDRDLVVQTGKRGRPRVDIHADNVFAPRGQTPDDAWAYEPRAADD